tara:strand:+ start:220 stop:615 length:396 start_codon:yes stop_codon:yes gene_type:complete
MEIKNLEARQTNVEIELDVTEVGEAREFQKFGKPGRVATAQAKDANGDTIKLTLWNEDIDKVKLGDKIKLTNGYVSEWQGELQLTTGKFGKLEVVGSSDQPDSKVYRNYPPEEDKKILDEPQVDEETVEEI